MNDLIRAKLKEVVKLKDTKKYDLNYKLKREKTYNFGKYLLPIVLEFVDILTKFSFATTKMKHD